MNLKKIGKVFTSKFVGTGRARVIWKKEFTNRGLTEIEKHWSIHKSQLIIIFINYQHASAFKNPSSGWKHISYLDLYSVWKLFLMAETCCWKFSWWVTVVTIAEFIIRLNCEDHHCCTTKKNCMSNCSVGSRQATRLQAP
jgi:hypothetical protein